MEPLSLLNEGIGVTVSITRFIIQFNGVKDETGIVLQQVRSVAGDVAEAGELYLDLKTHLSDGDQFRTEAVIRGTKRALNAIAKQVEPARKDKAKHGNVNLLNRVDWMLRRSSATNSCQANLATYERSLHSQINYLRMCRLASNMQNVQHLPSYEEAATGNQNSYFETDELNTVPEGMR